MDLIKLIEKYDYISFDIFDTLVLRDVVNPHDVFDIVENKYNSLNDKCISFFRRNRIDAQKKACQINSNKIEPTIDDIYECLEDYYEKSICKKLKKIEKEVEVGICKPNKKFIDVYNVCLKENKKIIITSDMYLDIDTIKNILSKCGINNYVKLYLSSKYQKRKSNGEVFSYIFEDLDCTPDKVMHIGDNLISDIIMPKLKHIKTYRVKNINNNSFYNKKVLKNDKVKYSQLEKFISNNIDNTKSYYYRMGYETFGPILYGFAKWLDENIKTDKVFFLSRDGYLISEAYKHYKGKLEKEHSYFYASRRALIIPTFWMDDSLKDMLDKLYIRDYIQIGNLFRKLGLEKNMYENIVSESGYSVTDKVKYPDLFENQRFMDLFEKIKPIIHENSKKEFNLLKQYMKQEKFFGNVSIVDIGWNGNMQMAMENTKRAMNLDATIEGYYVGILPESKNINKIKMNGYLFDDKKNHNIYITLKVINSIFESMFLAPHGSVKTYEKKGKEIVPVLLPYEYDDSIEKKSYFEIQEGALKFIDDYVGSDLKYILSIDEQLSFYSLEKFAYYPKSIDVEKFGDFKFLEDDIIYLAKPEKFSFYLRHPKKLISDVYVSGWLIGFMKRLTKINIFYSFGYKMLIKIYLHKRKKKIGGS